MKWLTLSLILPGRKPSMKMYHIAQPYRAIIGCHNSSLHSRTLLSVIVLLAVVTLSGCSSTLELTSRWTNHELKVDGTGTEWKDATTLIPGPQVLVGIKNDRENLYVCLKTSNRITQVQMLALGTTVWIDTEGKKNKTFGIQFPVSGLLQGRRFPSQQNSQELQRLIDAAQRQFEILGPGKDEHRRVADKQEKGLDVHLGFADGTLTYELKVPLHKTSEHAYAIGADPSKPLTIGLETGDYSDAMRAQLSGSSRPAGGSGGGRGGRGGGQSPGGMGSDAPEPLKHWLIVHLTIPD
ncbi:MAG: hypothetical protein HW389_1603 [Bacteroidetes bacterium]|nr:hypothetical protein [Bacteroidota bacterium]